MYRKLLIASAVLAASSSIAFAANYKGDYKGEAAPAPCPTYSFAAGPYLGLSVGPRINFTGTPTVYDGIEGTLSGGWGMMMNPMFYLAGEIFVQDSASVKDYKAQLDSDDGVKSNWGAGFSVIPGYMINDHVLAYVRVGGVWTAFNDSSDHPNQTLGAWQVGLGGQTNVYQNWDVRAEYVYSGYGKLKDRGKVSGNNVNFGVVYKFV